MRIQSSGFRVQDVISRGRKPGVVCAMLLCVFLSTPPAFSQVAIDEQLAKEPSWKLPAADEVRTKVFNWLDDAELDPEARQKAEALWAPGQPAVALSQAELLELVIETIAAVDPNAEQLVGLTSRPHDVTPTPEFEWLDDEEQTQPFARNNLKLWLGKWLAQERRYDEANLQLASLHAEDVVDPATLLFYQSVCHHWMLQSSAGLKTIGQLMEQKKAIPRRYQQLAELMQADLAKLKEETLDHISRRMNDVTRRLDFGHAGKKVRGVEDGIIASLDKLIKDLEDQASGGGGGEGGGDGGEEQPGGGGDPNGIRSRSPAQDSRIAEGKGPGEVKSKKIGNSSGWGDLPPKEREAAIQQISKEFPSHYRDIIEQYFRKLASEEEEKK
jgi:hypothetical protein